MPSSQANFADVDFVDAGCVDAGFVDASCVDASFTEARLAGEGVAKGWGKSAINSFIRTELRTVKALL